MLELDADCRPMTALGRHVPGAHKITMNVVGFLKG